MYVCVHLIVIVEVLLIEHVHERIAHLWYVHAVHGQSDRLAKRVD